MNELKFVINVKPYWPGAVKSTTILIANSLIR